MREELKVIEVPAVGIRVAIEHDGEEVAHTYLYLLRNDLHTEPAGYIEDVFTEPAHRGQGLGEIVVEKAIDEARKRGCYKVVLVCKDELVDWYTKLGFRQTGNEMRVDFVSV